MWWEIIPSFTIITVVGALPALASRAINRGLHDGNPVRRNYTQEEPHGVLYHFRDVQHAKPSFWQTYVKVNTIFSTHFNIVSRSGTTFTLLYLFQPDAQGNGTVYKSNTLADLS